MVVVLALVGLRTCQAESTQIEVVVDFDGGERLVRGLEVEYFRDGEPERVGHMRLSYGPGGAPGPAKHTLKLDKGRYTAVLKLETDAGVERVERRFHVEDEASVKFTVRPGE
jgi:hypothetical protein